MNFKTGLHLFFFKFYIFSFIYLLIFIGTLIFNNILQLCKFAFYIFVSLKKKFILILIIFYILNCKIIEKYIIYRKITYPYIK